MKTAFSLKCIAWIQPAAWLLQSFWLTTHTHNAVWLPKSYNQCIQPTGLGGMAQEKGSRAHCRSWTVLHAHCTSMPSSGFPILQGNAEALERRGGTSAKNYRNRIVCVNTAASQTLDVFW